MNQLIQISGLKMCIWLMLLSGLALGNISINAWDCSGKDALMWDRTPGKNGGGGASCSCPCKGAKWMGVKGKYYTPYTANIWYKFPGESGEYKVTIHYQGDTDGRAPVKISFAGKQVGEGKIGTKNGKLTFGPKPLKKGDKVNVWIKSDYSLHKEKKHGNYGRFNKLTFTRSGPLNVSFPQVARETQRLFQIQGNQIHFSENLAQSVKYRIVNLMGKELIAGLASNSGSVSLPSSILAGEMAAIEVYDNGILLQSTLLNLTGSVE